MTSRCVLRLFCLFIVVCFCQQRNILIFVLNTCLVSCSEPIFVSRNSGWYVLLACGRRCEKHGEWTLADGRVGRGKTCYYGAFLLVESLLFSLQWSVLFCFLFEVFNRRLRIRGMPKILQVSRPCHGKLRYTTRISSSSG